MTASKLKTPIYRRPLYAVSALLLCVAFYAGYMLWSVTKTGAPQLEASTVERLFKAEFSDLTNTTKTLKDYRGKVIVLNFWATWCPPCRQEMPAFSKVQEALGAQGVQVIGMGIDSPSAIKEFALQFPVSYPLLMGGTAGMDLMRELGNPDAALPYTFVFNRDGQPAFSHLGMLTEETLSERLRPLL